MNDTTQSNALNGEVKSKETEPNFNFIVDEKGSYEFEGYKIVINEKIALTPVTTTLTNRTSNG